jgi:rubrerythrin
VIALSPSEWYVALLIANLLVVLSATVYYAARGYRWRPRRRSTPFVFRCTVCAHVYMDRRNVPMAECPKCGNMNESTKSF